MSYPTHLMHLAEQIDPFIFCHYLQDTDYSSPQAARVLMVAFWLSPYTAGALEESSLPEHRHFAPKTIRGDGCISGRIPCFFQHAEGIVSPPSQSIVRRL